MNGPYKIGTLSRLTGFSPALLRAWEKRFGLITPERGEGLQRVGARVRVAQRGDAGGETLGRHDAARLFEERQGLAVAVDPEPGVGPLGEDASGELGDGVLSRRVSSRHTPCGVARSGT